MAMTVCGYGRVADGFANGGVSIATLNDGSVFTMPPSTEGGLYRACWCAAESICDLPYEFVVDLGQLQVGGPDSSAMYECFEWVTCSIDYLYGTWLADGDRLLVVPSGVNCATMKLPLPRVSGVPQGGISTAAATGGRTLSWGSDEMRAAPGFYGLCWCGTESEGDGSCGPESLFGIPAGVLKVSDYVKYAYITRPKDPSPRKMDRWFAYALAIPLPILLALAVAFGWRRLSARMSTSDPEAPQLFSSRKAWVANAQEKARHAHSIEQVLQTRLRVAAEQEARAKTGTTNELDRYAEDAHFEELALSLQRPASDNWQSTEHFGPRALEDATAWAEPLPNGMWGNEDRVTPLAFMDLKARPGRQSTGSPEGRVGFNRSRFPQPPDLSHQQFSRGMQALEDLDP